jgi:PBSX family phage terminase large subunit
MNKLQLQPQFKPLLQRKRYKGAKGGRASGKSHFFAECIVKVTNNYPASVVCIREIQKSIKYSSKKLIEDKIKKLGLSDRFEITQQEIRTPHNQLIIFSGMQDHTADSITSLEDFDIAWVEEAQTISEYSLELLIPTIRKKNSEVWFSWNPKNESDAIEVFFKELDENNSVVVHANYNQNKLASQTILDEAERHRQKNPETFGHIWLGEYNNSRGQVFKKDMFKTITAEDFNNRLKTNYDENDDFWNLEDGENPSEIINYMSIDVAVTDTKTSDNSSITIGCIDQNNDKYVQTIKKGKWLSNELLERILKYANDYNVQFIGIEDSAISKTFIENLEQAVIQRNLPYIIIRLKTKGRNKVARIQQYILSAINNNRLYFVDKVDDDLLNEAINFPEGLLDDILDSLAYFVEMGDEHLVQSGGQQNYIDYNYNKGAYGGGF